MRSIFSLIATLVLLPCCSGDRGNGDGERVVTFSGSAVGAEAETLRTQLDAFGEQTPGVRVDILSTPDAADQRHQLYVQWLNARTPDPDILQLDVIWTAEFAAAGWILALDGFRPDTDAFFPAALRASSWRGSLYAIPWFVDVGMLYWRTDLVDAPPTTYAELRDVAASLLDDEVAYGHVWQGARYEGLVVSFLEHLHAFGGSVLDAQGRVVVDAEPAVEALRFMREAIHREGVVPEAALTWREEQTRFAFQNGRAVFMRNWPYAYSLMQDPSESRVAGLFEVAPLPAGPGGRSASALGGAQLAVNAHSEEPEAAWRLIEFLTRPEQMLERARALGQYPARRDAYDLPELADALSVDPARARAIIEHAVPRPVSPVYPQLSSILQIWLHRALTRQHDPARALEQAAREIRHLLERLDLQGPATNDGRSGNEESDGGNGNDGSEEHG
ncbi:MAG: ABC transporter substrate-binding protein [bacterium]